MNKKSTGKKSTKRKKALSGLKKHELKERDFSISGKAKEGESDDFVSGKSKISAFKFLKKKVKSRSTGTDGTVEFDRELFKKKHGVRKIRTSLLELADEIKNEMILIRMKFKPETPSERLFVSESEKRREALVESYKKMAESLDELDLDELEKNFNEMIGRKNALDMMDILLVAKKDALPRVQALKEAVLFFEDGVFILNETQETILSVEREINELNQSNRSHYEQITQKTHLLKKLYQDMEVAIEEFREGLCTLKRFIISRNEKELMDGLMAVKTADLKIESLLSGGTGRK